MHIFQIYHDWLITVLAFCVIGLVIVDESLSKEELNTLRLIQSHDKIVQLINFSCMQIIAG